jgi:hypothetical protein
VPEALADYLRRFQPQWVERYCLDVELSDNEVGALYINGVLQHLSGLPGGELEFAHRPR